MRRSLVGCALFALVLAGCRWGGAPEGAINSCNSELALPPSVSTDILFVIDNSNSMAEEQAKVASQLQTFVSTLAKGVVKNDFQVGVVTTGISRYAAECGGTSGFEDAYFPEESGRLQRGQLPTTEPKIFVSSRYEVEGDAWLDKVKLLVSQGVYGSGQEMGLEAARRALSAPLIDTPTDANPPGNKGFLRPGSRLLVVIVSDEDDCSVADPKALALQWNPSSTTTLYCPGTTCSEDADCNAEATYCVPNQIAPYTRRCQLNTCDTAAGRAALVPVQEYVNFFNTLDDGTGTGRKREVFLAVVGAVAADSAGKLVPARCKTATDEAYGVAVRYDEAVKAMGERGLIDSICNADYGATLTKIAELVDAPHSLELPDDPLDGHLLRIEISREDGSLQKCEEGAGFRYEPAVGSAKARVTLEGDCRLRSGDRIQLKLGCAS